MSEGEKKTKIRVFGEGLREVSVLVFVFGMLDIFWHEPTAPTGIELPSLIADPCTHIIRWYFWVPFIMVASGLTLWAGMWCEFRKVIEVHGVKP